jgi:hypothetical protein
LEPIDMINKNYLFEWKKYMESVAACQCVISLYQT